jgi:2',3'-cyclic-nucleotide 2'-phosphodiesterase (5'-nucleotidase family)
MLKRKVIMMKKGFLLFIVLSMFTLLTACDFNKEEQPDVIEDYVDIYYLNDFHGALTDSSSQIGISYIANLINTKKSEHPDNVLFLAGGDMLQGSALSNYYDGASTIELLNLMDLDAFTIGNHEFDWGLETVMQYKDGDLSNTEANFPFLGANIFYEDTTTIPEGIDPYTIIEKGNQKIGIIGTMGYGLEYSIATSKIDGYEFASPLNIIKDTTYYLRTEENVDFVIVMSHDSGSAIETEVKNLDGDYNVDVFFNAHSHNDYVKGDSTYVQMQSGHNGELVGHIHVDFSNGIDMKARNIDGGDEPLLYSKDIEVDALLETFILETDELFNEQIMISGGDFSTYELSEWISEIMLQSTNADIAFQNYGGTITDIEDGDVITYALLYQIFPFDNIVKTAELTGAEVKTLINNNALAYATDISYFDDETIYTVATNDYVFDKDNNPFIYSDTIVNTGLLLRELAVLEVHLQSVIASEFLLSNGVVITVNDALSTLDETTN